MATSCGTKLLKAIEKKIPGCRGIKLGSKALKEWKRFERTFLPQGLLGKAELASSSAVIGAIGVASFKVAKWAKKKKLVKSIYSAPKEFIKAGGKQLGKYMMLRASVLTLGYYVNPHFATAISIHGDREDSDLAIRWRGNFQAMTMAAMAYAAAYFAFQYAGYEESIVPPLIGGASLTLINESNPMSAMAATSVGILADQTVGSLWVTAAAVRMTQVAFWNPAAHERTKKVEEACVKRVRIGRNKCGQFTRASIGAAKRVAGAVVGAVSFLWGFVG